ncbi:hypothetical protein NIES4102_37540 [Chondrocystis sp. NIES-4102]|nr:hypothetical protein NIES4102_37540 [Chondrocystis sp. NIES-4102]
MKIEDLSFPTEVTEAKPNNIEPEDMGNFFSNLFDIFPGVPLLGFDDTSGFYKIEPITIEGTDLGI